MRLSQWYTELLDSEQISEVIFIDRMRELRSTLLLDIKEIDDKLLEAHKRIDEIETEDYEK